MIFEYVLQAKLRATLTKTIVIASLGLLNSTTFYHYFVHKLF